MVSSKPASLNFNKTHFTHFMAMRNNWFKYWL